MKDQYLKTTVTCVAVAVFAAVAVTGFEGLNSFLSGKVKAAVEANASKLAVGEAVSNEQEQPAR